MTPADCAAEIFFLPALCAPADRALRHLVLIWNLRITGARRKQPGQGEGSPELFIEEELRG